MNWYLTVLKKYAVFQGRARRKEYWYFLLFNLIIIMLLSTLDYSIGTFNPDTGIGAFGSIYFLAILLPSIAVGVRRLHDIGRTGWWMLVVLIPVIGTIILLVFFVTESESTANEYGPNPLKKMDHDSLDF